MVERREFIEIGASATSVVSGILSATSTLQALPYLSLGAAPFNLYIALTKVRKWITIAESAPSLKDRVFWLGRAIAKLGNGVGITIRPFIIAARFGGFSHTPFLLHLSTRILPPVMAVISSFGLVFGVWKCARTIVEYARFKREGYDYPPEKNKAAQAFFNWNYQTYHMNLDGLGAEELQKRLDEGIRFSLLIQSVNTVASALMLTASVLLIINSGAYLGPAAGLLIGSSLVPLTTMSLKNILAEEKRVSVP